MRDGCRVTLDEACRRIRGAPRDQSIYLRVVVTAPRAVHLGQPDWGCDPDPHNDEAKLRGFIKLSRPAAVRVLRELYVDGNGRQASALVELHDYKTCLFVN